MNNKFIGIFVIFFVAIFAMSSVNATDLTHHNFDKYFSMDVPKGVDFEKEDFSIHENGLDVVEVYYYSEEVEIGYYDSPMYSNETAAYFYQYMFKLVNPDSTKCYESQEGNLRIIEPTTKNGDEFPIVGLNEDGRFIILDGYDVDLLKEMAYTAEFK